MSTPPSIPIIDFSPFTNPTLSNSISISTSTSTTQQEEEEQQQQQQQQQQQEKEKQKQKQKQKLVAKELISACKSVGFAYIINHTVSKERVLEAFSWSEKWFALSSQEKKLAPHPPGSTVHRGYSWPGLEKVSNLMGDEEDDVENMEAVKKAEREKVADVKESYEIGSEQNQDQPNVWPPNSLLPGFREFTTEFYWECHSFAKILLHAMAIGLDLPDDKHFLPSHSGNNNQLRLLHYPPVALADIDGKGARLTRMPAHTDWGSLTMVFQDGIGGLEVEDPNRPGHFISASPVPNSIIMNVGDLMQRWSNDILKSTLHRVGPPPSPPSSSSSYKINTSTITNTDGMTPARYSIPYFVSPEGDSIVECLPTCTSEERPVKYKPIVWDEYRLMRASMQY